MKKMKVDLAVIGGGPAGIRQPDFEKAFIMLKRQIADEFRRHKYVTDNLEESDKLRYNLIMNEPDEDAPVSYTHLDVYKRQLLHRADGYRRYFCHHFRWY